LEFAILSDHREEPTGRAARRGPFRARRPGAGRCRAVVPVDVAACDGGQYKAWTDASGNDRYNQGPGQHDLLYVLDVNGRTLAISPPSIRPTRPLTGPSSRRSSTCLLYTSDAADERS